MPWRPQIRDHNMARSQRDINYISQRKSIPNAFRDAIYARPYRNLSFCLSQKMVLNEIQERPSPCSTLSNSPERSH